MSRVLALDDRDPSLVYSAGWSQGGTVDEYNSTTSFTDVPGRSVSLSFRGTGISVYGTIPARARGKDDPESAYLLDGGRPVRFSADTAPRIQYNQLFFDSGALPDTQHNLTITNLGDGAALFLDVLLVMVPSEAANTTTSSSTTTSATSTTSSLTTTTSASPVTVTVTASSTSSDDPAATAAGASDKTNATSGSSAAGVAGGVIAGVVVLFLVVLGVIFYRRRARRKQELDFPDFASPPVTTTSPAQDTQPTSQWVDPTPASPYPAYGGYDTPTNPNAAYNNAYPQQYIPPSQANLINPYDQPYANQGYNPYSGMYR